MFMRPSVVNRIIELVDPLTPDYFLRRVLVGETAPGLIAEDLGCQISNPLVQHTLEESRSFGAIMFPDVD
jgi:hypothetical protein